MLTGCQQQKPEVNIKFSTWGSETEIKILKPIIKEFEQSHPGIKVELLHIPQNYFQKLHMLVAANLSPDVIFVNNLNMPVYASGNIFTNLSEILENSDSLSKEDFFSQALSAMTYQKKLMAIPRDISNVVIYYNKDIFDKHGISYPKTNWTFDQFLNTAKKLTIDSNKDGQIETFGVSFNTYPIFYLPFIWSNGGKVFNKDASKFLLAQKRNCTYVQYYADLRNKYHVAPKASEAGNNTMAQLFMQGKVAMYISGRWSVPRFREDINFNWDITTFPAGTAGSIVGADGSGWAMYSKTKHPEEAWKLIQFLASKKSITKFSETGLIVPARKDVANSKNFLEPEKKPESSLLFLEIIKRAKPTPSVNRWNEVVDTIDVALEPVWNGNNSACSALKPITQDINELLE